MVSGHITLSSASFSYYSPTKTFAMDISDLGSLFSDILRGAAFYMESSRTGKQVCFVFAYVAKSLGPEADAYVFKSVGTDGYSAHFIND